MLRLNAKVHGSIQLSDASNVGELYQSHDQNRVVWRVLCEGCCHTEVFSSSEPSAGKLLSKNTCVLVHFHIHMLK